MPNIGELAVAWDNLSARRSTETQGWLVASSGLVVAGREALIGLDPDNRRCFLIPIGSTDVFSAIRTRGVSAVPQVLEDRSSAGRYLNVTSLRTELWEPFDFLVLDVSRRISNGERSGVKAFLETWSRWRELLGDERAGLLSESALIGLWAELNVLIELFSHGATSTDVWTGPDGAVHDFEGPRKSIEVKGTLSRERISVEIHGLEQLDVVPGRSLNLIVILLERDPTSGIDVPTLVRTLLSVGCDFQELYLKLARIGYFPSGEKQYAEQKFRLRKQLVYAVDSAFPRLIAEDLKGNVLPAGVNSIRYSVDLSGPSPTRLETEMAEAELHSFVHGLDS